MIFSPVRCAIRRFRGAVTSVVLVALAACGGDDLVLPNEGQPSNVDLVSGDQQTAGILQAATDSLVVAVTDRFGSPVAGVEVAWAPSGGGEVSPATSTTAANGRAATQRVLGPQPGGYGTTAVAPALPEDVVTFTTTAVASRLVLVTQPAAMVASGQVLDPQPVLQLQDPTGNPLARGDVSVAVQIAAGDGSLQGTTTRSSDATGAIAFTDLAIVGAPGARTLIFAASGYASATSTPVSLGIGAPASVSIAAGDGQTAAAGTEVASAPAVLVQDAGGAPVAGVELRFAVTAGGGSLTGANATTGADGIAAVGSWTLGGTVGANEIRATVQADAVSGNPVTFSATAAPGSPSASRSTVSAAPTRIAASTGSTASAIAVTVRDSRGNPVPGQTVTLSASGAGVTLAQPGATDASGSTTGRFSASGAGDHVVTAGTGGVTLGSATVTVTQGAPVAARTTVDVPPGTAGTPTSVTIRLQDEFGNPVAGAVGQVAVAVSGANPAGGLPVTDQGGGSYRATYTPAVTGTDQVDVRVAGQPVPGAPFGSVVSPGASDAGRTTAEVPDGSFSDPLTILVHVNDAQGNSVARDGDQVQVTLSDFRNAALPVEYVGNGTYRAVWTPFVVGTFEIGIELNGTPIGGSPFSTSIRFLR